MKILVTGSTGFLGRHFIKFIRGIYPDIQIIESNTKQNNLLEDLGVFANKIIEELGNGNSLDYIFHFACHTKAGDWCQTHQGEQWLVNQQINTNILKFWKDICPLTTFVTLGTSCSYGANCDRKEENYLKYEPESSLQTYAYTKRMLYLGLKSLNEQYGMRYYYFVPPTLFGTDFGENDQHFIYDIIRKVHKAQQENGIVEMWGDGTQKRELIWVNDFLKIMLAISLHNRKDSNKILNVGSGVDYSMEFYYNTICNLYNYPYNKVIMNKDKYMGMLNNKLTITNQIILYFSFEPLMTSIKQVVEFYENNSKSQS